MADKEKEGWQFWCNHNGRIRQFIVGHENEETAKGAIQTYDPTINNLNFVSKSRVSWELIEQLDLNGRGTEFVPVGPASEFQVGGMDIGRNDV